MLGNNFNRKQLCYCSSDLRGWITATFKTRAGGTGWCSQNRFWTQARNFVILIWWWFLWNSFEIRLQKNEVMGRIPLYCKVMLWPWRSRQRPKCCAWHVVSIWWLFLWNSFKIQLQITKFWAGHHYVAKWFFDHDLQCLDPNVARDTSF